MIFVVSHPGDDHAVGVLGALWRAGHSAALIDTAKFPSKAFLTQCFEEGKHHCEFLIEGRRIDLDDCRVGWWRRPQPFTLEPGIAPDALSFAYTECHEAVAGLWTALDVTWVNPPDLDELAHHKPYQLAVAAKIGFPIPRTVITNDPDAARRLISELGPGRTVYKTFLASQQCWRETRIMRPEEVGMLEQVKLAPVIFQEFVPATADIRVTVVGSKMFATAITASPRGYQPDYRVDLEGARFESTELPPETETKIAALMARLGLVYGAIDLRLTHDGRYVFLEVNPAGEWRFIEDRTGQRITDAMADLLIRLDRH